MSFTGILSLLGIVILGGCFAWFACALMYGPVALLGKTLTYLARTRLYARPGALFLAGTLIGLGMAAGFGVASFLMDQSRVVGTVLAIVFMLMMIIGSLELAGFLRGYPQARKERKAFEAGQALPKFQLWIQDLLVLLVAFGFCMAVYSDWGERAMKARKVLGFSAYILAALAIGQWIAWDVCRRSGALQRPLPRMLVTGLVALLVTLAYIVPMLVVWNAWRHALWQSGQAIALDRLVYQREATGRAVEAIVASPPNQPSPASRA